MDKYKQVIINLSILTFLLSSGATTAYAIPNEYSDASNFDSNEEARVLETFEDGDYSAWKKIISRQNILADYIDSGKFNKFIKARELARGGKYSEALVLIGELKNEIAQIEKIAMTEKNDDKLYKKVNSLNKRTEFLKKKLKNIV